MVLWKNDRAFVQQSCCTIEESRMERSWQRILWWVSIYLMTNWRFQRISRLISTDEKIFKLIKAKHRTAAWFVSHCKTDSKRDDVARNLQDFIDVDIYGQCGNLTCPRFSKKCSEMLNATYKFYLSFENSLCLDYLTEKLYEPIESYVIPVVYSGADLSHFLPPKSYINVEDFDTIEELANHLKFLSKNPKEYLKYFWWKRYYKVTKTSEFQLCEFCQKLNDLSFISKKHTFESVTGWFNKNQCRQTTINLWKVWFSHQVKLRQSNF